MLPFGVTIPVTVSQKSEIPEGLMNYSVFWRVCKAVKDFKFCTILNNVMNRAAREPQD